MKLDINQYLEEYTGNAEIVSEKLGIDEYICCICTKIAFKPVECNQCEKYLCSKCYDIHKE